MADAQQEVTVWIAAIIKDKFSGESRNESRPRTDRPRTGGGGGRGGGGRGRY